MSDIDRFTAFLRREAASYNEPPQVPEKAIWRSVEKGLADTAAASSGTTGQPGESGAPASDDAAGDAPIHAPGYHAAPPPPRDEMWDRIEASWALRSRTEAAGAGAPSAHGGRWPHRRWSRHQRTAGWATALAAAASLALWIGLDNSAEPLSPGDPEPVVPPATPVAQSDPVAPQLAAEQATVDLVPGIEPVLESGDDIAVVAQPHALESVATGSVAAGHLPGATAGAPTEVFPDLGTWGDGYLQTRHLDRTATLLTAFRIDQRTRASEMELASWASQLLVDTRVFLDMPVSRSPLERALLEDLELVLLQISRLGPGVPDFEWQLARESMEWKGTLMRVRAASAAAES